MLRWRAGPCNALKKIPSIINPVLLIEVFSDSTEAYERGKKFEYFRQLASLQEYALLSQHEPLAQVYYRSRSTDLWQMVWVAGLDGKLTLQSSSIETTLGKLYLKTEGL